MAKTEPHTKTGDQALGARREALGNTDEGYKSFPRASCLAPRASLGFTYLSLLFFVAILGVGLAAAAVSWQTARQREKEAELLFAGTAFREAIALYYNRSPGTSPEFPKRLRDLLQDPRYPDTRRYLRRLYADPMVGEAKWGIITSPDGGIMGVHSLSSAKPVKVAGAVPNGPDFAAAASYAEWQFVYLPEAGLAPGPGANAQPATSSGMAPASALKQ